MKRLVLFGGGALILVVVVAVVFVYSSFESIVETAIETIGSDITGTAVRLDDVDISMSSGSGALRGFRVANPGGFREDDVFRFDEVTMVIDRTTLKQNPVVINEIVILGAHINYEIGTRGTNVGRVRKNVEDYGAGNGGEGPRLIIEHLYFRDGTITVTTPLVLDEEKITTPLPDLHLQDIGTRDGGATAGEVAGKIMAGLGRKIAIAVNKIDD